MVDLVFLALIVLLGIVSISVIFINDLLVLTITTSIISTLCAVIYIMADAVDVAFTEAAVGAGVSTALALLTIHLTKSYSLDEVATSTKYNFSIFRKCLNIFLAAGFGLIIAEGLMYAPIFGDLHAPANNHIYYTYIKNSYTNYEVQNVVTMILGAFRGFDTLGETLVVLVAALGVYLVLQGYCDNENSELNFKQSSLFRALLANKPHLASTLAKIEKKEIITARKEIIRRSKVETKKIMEETKKEKGWKALFNFKQRNEMKAKIKNRMDQLIEGIEESADESITIPMKMIIADAKLRKLEKKVTIRKDFIVTSTLFTLIPIISLFAFYVQFHGDFGPGGGFQAGVILSSIYIMITFLFGYQVANSFISINTLLGLLAVGALLYLGVGYYTVFAGGKFLDYIVFGFKMESAYHYGLFLIELGVGITVFTAMATIIGQFYLKITNPVRKHQK